MALLTKFSTTFYPVKMMAEQNPTSFSPEPILMQLSNIYIYIFFELVFLKLRSWIPGKYQFLNNLQILPPHASLRLARQHRSSTLPQYHMTSSQKLLTSGSLPLPHFLVKRGNISFPGFFAYFCLFLLTLRNLN